MSLVLADVGARTMLNALFNNSWPSSKNLTIKLFTNNVTPVDTNVAGDFTEATGGGYAAKTLANGSWVVNEADNPADAVFAEQAWTFTGLLTTNTTIYGYFVVNGDGILQWAELIPYPMTPANNGDQLRIVPKFQLSKGTPS